MAAPVADQVWHTIGRLLTMAGTGPSDVGAITRAALAAYQGRVVWAGPQDDLHRAVAVAEDAQVHDAGGRLVTPGFVDSHTHLVWAGDRSPEFHERLSGISYTAQLGTGRGIHSTVAATRAADDATLYRLAASRLANCLRHGSTTVEVKTGYGLDTASEARSLEVITRLAASHGPRVVATFMGAHVVPREYQHDRAAYVREVIATMLPAFRGRAAFADVFCEEGAFTPAESRAILEAARALGYGIKLHANQFGSSGGAMLAAELGAVSADHLDYLDDTEIHALRQAGVTAVLLPGCSMTLRAPYPDGRRLVDAGVPVALATDFNPGTCHCENMQLMLALACLNMHLTIAEALRAATRGGARALGMEHQVGSLEPGMHCDLLLWDLDHELQLGYSLGVNRLAQVVVGGVEAALPPAPQLQQ